MSAPVIIFVYNRPIHTKMTFESLRDNYDAKDSDVIIFSDYARDQTAIERVLEVRDYIKYVKNQNWFKSVSIFESEENMGLAKSIIDGVSKVFEHSSSVIVLEDDLITSKDFLRFMNSALSHYSEDHRIWSISGYNIPIKVRKNYKHDVYLSLRGSSWGWGTWRDRWKMIDWNVSDYNEFKKSLVARNGFNLGGRDLSIMLDLQMEGKIDSWAIRWCYTQFRNGMFTVYPTKSKVENKGFDGSGTHGKHATLARSSLASEGVFAFPNTLEPDQVMIRRFRNYYLSISSYIVIVIKLKLKKIGYEFKRFFTNTI